MVKTVAAILIVMVLSAGCSSDQRATTRPSSARERQDAALRDPFGYSPEVDQADVSGGKVGQYDRKAMRKDIDHVLNP